MSEARPGRVLALALASVVASFLPFVGVAVAAAAVALAARRRRSGAPVPGALPIALLGALLSLGFTAAYVACSPSRESPAERRTWREFDRLFAPSSTQGPGNAGGNHGGSPAGP